MRDTMLGVTMLWVSLYGFAEDRLVPEVYPTIQEAIEAADSGDRVVVAPGQYTTDVPITFLGKDITVVAEAGPEQTTISMADPPADPDRASVVIFENGEGNDSVLEGFTLTGGQGTLVPECPCTYGGAVCCKVASPTLIGCVFTGNRSRLGGGVGLYESNAILTGCTVEGNSAFKGGGIQASFATSVVLEDCTIAGNEAEVDGGGIRSYSCSITVTACTIQGNTAGNYGGGTIAEVGSTEALTDCSISGNSARLGGGVFSRGSCSSELTSCTIRDNVGTFGGGLCRGGGTGGSALLENCVVSANRAITGGGIYCYPSSFSLDRCTVAGNAACGGHGGGLFCSSEASPTLESCILWNNSGGSILFWDDTASVNASYCCIEGDGPWLDDITNITDDPRFCAWGGTAEVWVDGDNPGPGDGTAENPFPDIRSAVAGYDLALAPDSPCLGAGEAGADMGADTGLCVAAGSTARLVHVAPGAYDVEDSLLCCRVTLEGAGAESTVLRGSVLGLSSGTVLSDVTVTGGTRGGIAVGSLESPTIKNCIVTANTGEFTGGISCGRYASPTIEHCSITRNSTGWGAGFKCYNDANPTFSHCLFTGNTAITGGGIYCNPGSSLQLDHCTIAGNAAGAHGGGVFCHEETSVNLTSCIVWHNSGGSIRNWNDGASIEVRYCCIEGDGPWLDDVTNTDEDPRFGAWGDTGEVWVDGANPGPGDGTAENPFSDIRAAVAGYDLALATDSPCLGAGEDGADVGADTGLCVVAGSTARLVHVAPGTYDLEDSPLCCRVSVEGAGAGSTVLNGSVFGLRTSASFSGVTVTGGSRGGIWVGNWEAPTIERCIATGNTGEYTGGISCWDFSNPTISDCTFANNQADTGGGISCQRSSARFTNCVIVENTARLGGAVYCYAGTPLLDFCTIADNTATEENGGLACEEGSIPELSNCIVWANDPASVCGQQFHCLLLQDPLFVDPVNGDFRLQADSPAIDAGTCIGAPDHDRDGNPRPVGATCDIGAYEYRPEVTFSRGDANADSAIDIADAVFTLSYLFASGAPPSCLDAADANDDGAVDIADAIAVLSYLFAGAGDLPEPFGECGIDPTVDELGCSSFPPCE